MKTLKFVKVIYRNHKIIDRKTLFVWSDVTPKTARIICQNFYDGFCAAFSKDFRCPIHPLSMGYTIDSWNLHKDGCGWQYCFVNGLNRVVKFSK